MQISSIDLHQYQFKKLMMHLTQLFQNILNELLEKIITAVKLQLDDLKKDFQPKEPTELLTRTEVSKFFKVDISTVHNWTKKGKLKSYGIGNRVYYKRQEIEQAIIEL